MREKLTLQMANLTKVDLPNSYYNKADRGEEYRDTWTRKGTRVAMLPEAGKY